MASIMSLSLQPGRCVSNGSEIKCEVTNCRNSSNNLAIWKKTLCGIHSINHEDCPCQLPYCLYKFPRNEAMKRKWIQAINRNDFAVKATSVVCSKHFITSRPTNENPTPCLDLGYVIQSNGDNECVTLAEESNAIKLETENKVTQENKEEIFIAIVHSACNTFANLKMCILKEKSLLSIEITKDVDTVFFPAISGSIPIGGYDVNSVNENFATAEIYSVERAVVNPLKILVASRSWSANLIAFGRKISVIEKIACKKDLWEVEKGFIELLRKVSNFGMSDVGGFKLCCGITEDEYAMITCEETDNILSKRFYPGGGYVYEDCNCSMLIEMLNSDQVKFPYHRCEMCKQRLNNNLSSNVAIEKKIKLSNEITTMSNDHNYIFADLVVLQK